MAIMSTDALYDLYNANIESILNQSMMSTIADRRYNIYGYNLINRLLIYMQNKYVTAVKSLEGWNIIGRNIKNKSSSIWVIDNIVHTVIIDPLTDLVVNDHGLSVDELAKAVQLGILKREKRVYGIKTVPIYNIKDTFIFDKQLYSNYVKGEQKQIRVSSLLELVESNFNVECVKGESSSSYNKYTNTLVIGTDSFQSKLDAIADSIVYSNNIRKSIDWEDDISEDVKDIIEKISVVFMRESLKSFSISDYNVEAISFIDMESLDFSNETIRKEFIQYLAIVYDIVEDVVCAIKPESHSLSESTLRKANEFLTILEASEQYVKLWR